MPSKSKDKGNRFERELVTKIKKLPGLEAERAYGSNGEALGEAKEVDVRIRLKCGEILTFQCKSNKKFPKYMRELIDLLHEDKVNCLAFKANHKGAYIVCELDYFLKLIS